MKGVGQLGREEKNKNLANVVLNPVRMRIIQYLLTHRTGTAAEIGSELSDIPTASLYRHLGILQNSGLIGVQRENKIRGTLQKVYRLEKQESISPNNYGEARELIKNSLLSLIGDFERYFQKGERDLQKDLLLLNSMPLVLSDEEFMALLKEMTELLKKYLEYKPKEGRKMRKMTIISSPVWEEISKRQGEEDENAEN